VSLTDPTYEPYGYRLLRAVLGLSRGLEVIDDEIRRANKMMNEASVFL
jgi:hypothetical protein